MQKLQVFVDYAHSQPQLGLTRNPLYLFQILQDSRKVKLLTKPLPSTEAYQQLGHWQARLQGRLGFLWRHAPAFVSNLTGVQATSTQELAHTLEAVQNILHGKILTESQLLKIMRQQGFWPSWVSAALDFGVNQGVLNQEPGFRWGSWGSLICTRCQSDRVQLRPCLNCGSAECWYCLNCESLGGNRGCSTYFTTAAVLPQLKARAVDLKLDFAFTPAQNEASLALVDFWESADQKALVWAACGAGKTEVTFGIIQKALAAGYEVLFAIPRTDIVREMAERLEQAFPTTVVVAHFAGQPLFAQGQLVVATTHQVLHFYQRFQLVILDEVDAFPYDGNELLRFALWRSLAAGGKVVEMTATPKNIKAYDRVITIPARFHGHPLPEPRLLIQPSPPWESLEQVDLPEIFLDLLGNTEQKWLVFAPTILACTELFRVLELVFPKQVGLCHSQKQDRTQVIKDFRSGKLRILVSTSVLERGVNFPGVNVLVLSGEHEVFSTSALVQMAGRVGRSVQFPQGQVVFSAAKQTPAITKALDLIQKLNADARARGLLKNDSLS